MNSIEKRHNIVHRNGKTKEGKEFIVKKKELQDLIENTTCFVNNIEEDFTKYTGEEINNINELF